ncbi:MAG: NUDIX hydrolase [Hyphomicrobiaceae bacterium]
MVQATRYDGWPRAASSIVVFRGRSVLLVKRAKPPILNVWSLPGGHIEPGETAADAALRELAEETGCIADLLGLVAIHDAIMRDANGSLSAHYVIAVHAAVWRANAPVAASDAAAAAFHDLETLAELALTPNTGAVIRSAHDRYASETIALDT